MTQDNHIAFGGAQSDDMLDGGDAPTIYEALQAALSAKVEKEPVTLTVPNRPTITLRFNPEIEFEMFQSWITRAQRGPGGKKLDSPDYMRMAMTVISHTNTGILINGKDALNSKTGEAYTVRSPQIHQMLKVPEGSVAYAIKALYNSDGHAIQAMRKIVEAAGYSVDGDVIDADDDPLEI